MRVKYNHDYTFCEDIAFSYEFAHSQGSPIINRIRAPVTFIKCFALGTTT